MSTTISAVEFRRTTNVFFGLAIAWLVAVIIGSETGFFSSLHQPLIGALVAFSIIVPTIWYFLSSRVRLYVEAIGHRRIMLLHIWRIPAALMFFWYGASGQLPPVFWILAGVGDFIAGSLALYMAVKPESLQRYSIFNSFGFLDFVVAVGTGLTYTLMEDTRMAPIAVLPMALIPLFGVGISGATHLMAFDMLRRKVGLRTER
ncbi:MAG: permease [Betaproteobacteria bacterium]|nr:MAG: permease [Betaproteobacteria bacterium]